MKNRGENCFDIVEPFVAELYKNNLEHDVQIIGGLGSFALQQNEVVILVDEKKIWLPDDIDHSDIAPMRKVKGLSVMFSTRRDVDILVKTANPDKLDVVATMASHAIGNKLRQSVFGLHDIAELWEQHADPIGSTKGIFLSDRYVHEQADGQIVEAKKALYPFAVDMPVDSLDNWWLHRDGKLPIPIGHPGRTILDYITRSVSGVRHKDTPKVGRMVSNLHDKAPSMIKWITDGPGKPMYELAQILHTLREPDAGTTLDLGEQLHLRPMGTEELFSSPHFLIDAATEEALSARVMALKQRRARVVRWGDKSKLIVALFQIGESFAALKSIVTNKRSQKQYSSYSE